MLTRVPLEKSKSQASSVFGSLSLSACVASILEIDDLTDHWEEHGFDWFSRLDQWCHHRGMQVLQLVAEARVRGLHIRFCCDPTRTVTRPDGEEAPKLEATVWGNDELIYNPSEIDLSQAPLHNTKLIFVPYDPTPTIIRYVH